MNVDKLPIERVLKVGGIPTITHNSRIFGSVLHGKDDENSDLDLLVDATASTTLLDLGAIHYKVSRLLGIGVDVWITAQEDLPELKAAVQALRVELAEDDEDES